jgi:hypothetical protein
VKHISESTNFLRLAIFNARCRLNYIWRLGWAGVVHRHIFKRWTGASNLLCWCGAVRTESEVDAALREYGKYREMRDREMPEMISKWGKP